MNDQYDKQGLAIVTKIPTPIKVLKIHLGKIVEAFFEKKSTVDYNGMVQGYGICFDAKETDKDSLPLKNIHQHQVNYMNKYKKQQGYAFILCHFKSHNRFYLIPIEIINHYWVNAKKGGRKSIPIEALDKKYIIPNQNGLPNYLVALNHYIDDCIKKNKSA
jgi:recombination protein U